MTRRSAVIRAAFLPFFVACLGASSLARADTIVYSGASVSILDAGAELLTREFRGAYYDVNQDTALIYTGVHMTLLPADTIYFGILGAETRARNAGGDTLPWAVGSASASGGAVLQLQPQPSSAPEPGAALLVVASLGLLTLRRR